MDALNIYLPRRVLPTLERHLHDALRHRAPVKRFDPVSVVHADALRCFSLSLSGTLTHVRAPYAFPFLTNQICNEYPGNLHLHPGVDWLVLGSGSHRLTALAAENVAATGVSRVHLHPFEEIDGEIDQTVCDRDIAVCLARTTANYNQSCWEQTENALLGLPEHRWHEVCSNAHDVFASYAPHIRRYLGKEPATVVDIGCGLGQTARTLAATYPNARVIGLDLSRNAIRVARRTFALPNLEFVEADISADLGLAPASVDLVVSNNALMYAEDQLETARRIFTFLHPDGLCINNCRMGPSHSYWDFPRSLLLPTVFQLQPADWIRTAAHFQFNTRIVASPSAFGFDPIYFYARNLADFRQNMARLQAKMQNEAHTQYRHYQSHALFLHSRHVQGDAELPFESANHLRGVQDCILSLPGNDQDVRNNTLVSWLYCFARSHLYPEAARFFRACLPKAASLLDAVFPRHVLETVARERS